MTDGLRSHLQVRRGAFTLDADLTVAPGEILAVLGPNGAGKTTALRILAGLLRPSGGLVRLGETVLDDPAAGTHVPAQRRPIGVVFQDYRLFPHLSALDNVAFGLRCRAVDRRGARTRAADRLAAMGLAEFAAVRPGELSGGQAQRVALARALAPEPALLLLDEPLAALDARTRLDVRAQLRRHLAGFDGCTVLVTHDPLDAMVLADRLSVVEAGRIVQHGSPTDVAERPRTDYVARLLGLNLFRGRADRGRVHLDDGGELTVIEAGHARGSGDVLVAFRPSAVAVFGARPEGSPRNVWAASVRDVELNGGSVRLHLDGPMSVLAEITPAAVSDLDLVAGREVWIALKATEIAVYPA